MLIDIEPELLQHVEEQRAFNATLADFSKTFEEHDFETPEGLANRRKMLEPGGPFCQEIVEEAEDRAIPGPDGPVTIRVFVPPKATAVYLSIHGGGMVFGSARQRDQTNWELANFANVVVVCPEYRLAPEHPYPAANEDCEAVAVWLVDHARSEFGSARLLIGGESGGAYLAAGTLLRLKARRGSVEPFDGANLANGVYDLGGTPSLRASTDPLLPATDADKYTRLFLPGLDAEARRAPGISPLYADLRGLCPALFTVGTLDGVLDDSVFMAARWQLAGNDTTLLVYPEASHGFTLFPTKIGEHGKDRILRFIAERAAPSDS